MRSARVPLLLAMLLAALVPLPASAAGHPVETTWAGSQIRLYDAFRAGWTGRGVTVAVLDGWVDTTHPDFQGRAVAGADCTGTTCTTTMGRDACGSQHGTHVAGTVGSSSYGVAPGARLLAVRVLKADSSGECTGDPAKVAAGIRWAVAHGAKVLNLSLGPDVPGQATTSAIPAAVHDAATKGVVVVFSAGNADLPVAQAYGGDALVVAATAPSGGLASYSQHGAGVSVAAPGGEPNSAGQCSQATCITSLYPANRYAVAAGTSMAAPHVAGLAALLLQQRPGRGRADVIDRITGTAHALSGAGSGRVDVAAALGVKHVVTPPKPSPTPTKARRATPKPSPTHASVRAVATPSPLPLKPSSTPTPVPSPSAVPEPVVTTPAPLAAPTTLASNDEIPIPLAGIAGALVGLAAAALFAFGKRWP